MPSDLHLLLTGFAALVVVLALVWAGSYAARFTGLAPRRTGGRVLAVRDAIALDSRRRLVLVQCGHRGIVLLTGGSRDLVVGWLDESAPPAPASQQGPEG